MTWSCLSLTGGSQAWPSSAGEHARDIVAPPRRHASHAPRVLLQDRWRVIVGAARCTCPTRRPSNPCSLRVTVSCAPTGTNTSEPAGRSAATGGTQAGVTVEEPLHGPSQPTPRRGRGPYRAGALGRRSHRRHERRSTIGASVRRATRYVMPLHLPNGHSVDAVLDAPIPTIKPLPQHLRRSSTWD